jgi:hypothetical protein
VLPLVLDDSPPTRQYNETPTANGDGFEYQWIAIIVPHDITIVVGNAVFY